MKKQVDYQKIEQNAQRRNHAFKVIAYVFLGFWALTGGFL